MYCAEFERRINAALDARRTPTDDEQIVAHAADCGECQRLLASYEALLEGTAGIAPVAMRRDIADAVVARLTRQRVLERRRWRGAAMVLTAAAVVLLAVAPQFFAERIDVGPADVGRPVAQRAGGPPAVAQDVSAPRHGALVDEARQTYGELWSRTGESFASALALIATASVDDSRPQRTVAPPADESSESDRELGFWRAGLASELRPIAQSAGGSLAALLKIVPDSGPGITQ